ncbi:Neurexin-3, partial [Frankliniella fusca]
RPLVLCVADKAPPEATFRGTEYLSYDLSRTGGEPIVSTQDTVSLSFKTRSPNGLLFYTGEGADYLNLALKDGGVILSMNLSNGRVELSVRPNRVRFDDNAWHTVVVHRRVQVISTVTTFCHVTMNVDGVYTDRSHTAGSVTILASSRVFVGGSDDTLALPGSKQDSNFVGCLRKVEFSADSMRLSLIEMARTGQKLISVVGHLDFQCQEVGAGEPVTFTTPESFLMLPNWDAPRSGSLSLKLRTNEPNGLVLYSHGANSSHPDLFALELVDGHLFLHLDLGSGPLRVKAPRKRLADGAWHELTVSRAGREGRITIDGASAEFSTPGKSTQLELGGGLVLGGLGPGLGAAVAWRHPTVQAGVLRQGFVGCLRDLVIDGTAVDLTKLASHQDSGAIRPMCRGPGPGAGLAQGEQGQGQAQGHCEAQPCMNGGRCSEGWNRFLCDCSATAFTGPTCGKEATTLTFNGSQHVWVSAGGAARSQAEEVALRFRTKFPVGLLMATSSDQTADRLELVLSGGRARATLRLGDREKSLVSGEGLNDDQWHTVRFSRRGENFRLQVDEETPSLGSTALARNGILEWRTLHIGGWLHPEEEMQMTSTVANFAGSMQQLTFNGLQYLELARAQAQVSSSRASGGSGSAAGAAGAPGPHITVTATIGKRDSQLVHHPVHFKSKHTFVGLPTLKAYSVTNIYFQFKTRQANGILLYNGGRDHDFLAVELISGHVHFIFDLGDGPVRLHDNAHQALNDNRWHSVTISRPGPHEHSLLVDEAFSSVTSKGKNENLDLDGLLYVGGLPEELFSRLPRQVTAHQGFEGCLASLDLNGESPNLVADAAIPSQQVSEGCAGQSTRCSQSVCANRGVCVQQWNSYACDCDLTSYTGPSCSEESLSYEFGPGRGLITYAFPEERRPEMKSDVIALGFITTKDDAILLRVDSATSQDYMELEIVEGNMFMVYNMGTSDHPIGDISVRVNDNQYHVVRFTRSGANSTIQIDDYNVQTQHPPGHQLSVFNSQSKIQVGGRWSASKKKVERAFSGVISGLVFNGIRVLDLAASKDRRTLVRGEVQPLKSLAGRKHEPPQRMQQTSPSAATAPGAGQQGSDDLVFSGAGSGCSADDEDECTPVIDPGGSDDLITPVFVPPTRSPAGAARPGAGSKATHVSGAGGAGGASGKPACDDEDCFVGSGSGENTVTEPESNVSSTAAKGSSTPSSAIVTSESEPSTTGAGGATSEVPYLGTFTPGSAGPGLDAGQVSTTTVGGTTGQGPGPGQAAPGSSAPDFGPSSVDPLPPTSTVSETTSTSSSTPSSTSTQGTTRSTTTSTTTTTTTTEYPRLPPTIIPRRPGHGRDRDNNRITSEASENAALIIGVIAGSLIAIILIVLIILKVKSRGDGAYKVDESLGYAGPGHSPHAALLAGQQASPPPAPHGLHPHNGSAGALQRQQHGLQPGLQAGLQPGPVSQPRKKQGVKEWYV